MCHFWSCVAPCGTGRSCCCCCCMRHSRKSCALWLFSVMCLLIPAVVGQAWILDWFVLPPPCMACRKHGFAWQRPASDKLCCSKSISISNSNRVVLTGLCVSGTRRFWPCLVSLIVPYLTVMRRARRTEGVLCCCCGQGVGTVGNSRAPHTARVPVRCWPHCSVALCICTKPCCTAELQLGGSANRLHAPYVVLLLPTG
jgi:hypothetical protein